MKNRIHGIVIGALMLALCTGCNEEEWLHGDWVFDGEYTESLLPQAQSTDDSVLQSMARGFNTYIKIRTIEAFEGTKLLITSDEIVAVQPDGSRVAEGYEIIDRPNDESWTIKYSDDRIETFHRDGNRLTVMSKGVVFRAYFIRVED